MELIAHRRYRARRPDGEEFEIELGVGAPIKCDDIGWKCPVSMKGLYGRLPDIHGIDSWQALMLALSLARKLLEAFVEDGGTLLDDAGAPITQVEPIFRTGIP